VKKYLITVIMLFAFITMVACDSNSEAPEIPTTVTTPTQTESNQADAVSTESPVENIPTEELEIQIVTATDEFLGTFTNIYQADLGTPGYTEGATLVIWANQPLFHFNVAMLIPDLLEDRDEWGFRATDSFGSAEILLPGEAFVIKNYMGLGTLPYRGVSFTDENGENIRVFFFQENHAYPEHGGQWIIQEIEADRLIWTAPCGFDAPNDGGNLIIINGAGYAGSIYTIQGEQLPTHVTMSIMWGLGIDAIQGGSQVSLQYGDAAIGVGLSVVNYLATGADRVAVGIDDTFMADDGYFTQYVPITLLRALGFDVYFEGGRVHIDGQFDASITRPHPLAIALQSFNANAEGETKAFIPNVGGNLSVVAIKFVDTFFAEATLFVYTGFEVLYKEIGSIEGFPFSIGVTTDGWGSFVKLTGDGGSRSYTMLDVATNPATLRDEIVYLFTIYAERADDESIHYFRFDGGWLEGIEGGRHPITEEEFNAIRNGMGDRIISWRDITDETESILAMSDRIW